jgi:ubiquinone/menaquinone biosynthesis C-methylase UbiE
MPYRAEFDAAICTIALSVIPGWQEALRRMVEAVRPGGRVVVVDGRLGKGIARLGNVYARLFARVVAADVTRDIPGKSRQLLTDAREESMMFGTYFIVSGRRGAGA